MEIDYLREFLVLAETKNYWEASERLYIGQSTLSKHIRHMEEELEVPLFERSTRRVELTEYGRQLIPYARTITEARLDYRSHIQTMKDEEAGKLVVGVIPSMVQYKITDLLVEYNRRWPGGLVRVLEGDTTDLLKALRENQCSLAFLRESDSFPIDEEEFDKIPYMTDHAVALLPADHPLLGSGGPQPESLSLSQLSEESYIMLQETSILREIFYDACLKAGFRPNIVFDCQRMDSIFDLVSQGMGISLTMDHHLDIPADHDSIRGRIVKIPLKPELESRIYLCCRRGVSLGKAARNMTGLVRELQGASDLFGD